MLKMNTTLNLIDLGCEMIAFFFFFVFDQFFLLVQTDNRIASTGMTYIIKALIVNSTLTELSLKSKRIVSSHQIPMFVL